MAKEHKANKMPLNDDAPRLIRENLLMAAAGRKPRIAVIGTLSDEQLQAINAERATRKMRPITAELMFDGRHIHKSRIEGDGYSIDDVVQQITASLNVRSIARITPKMTVIQSQIERRDGYGNMITDEAVLECSMRFPRAELYSVIPKGDNIKPRDARKNKKDRVPAALLEKVITLTDSPG
jgi:hypothetical protein